MSFLKNVSNKYGNQLLDTGTNASKTASKNVVHKAAEATGEFLENEIANAVTKSYNNKIV